MKKPIVQRIGDFMAGKGFYIVLFLCVAAMGISGYYLFSSMHSKTGQTVSAPVQVTVTPSMQTVTPVKPTVSPTTKPSASSKVKAAEPSASAATIGASVYTWPVQGKVIADFSLEVLAYDETMGDWRTHSGIDIAADLGTQVLATSAGTVEDVKQDDLMGTTVIIRHADDMESVYSNLAALPTVKTGDKVSTGDVIGSVGQTAIAESARPPHLYFEMRQKGQPVDPETILPER
ncbi:MAG: M23 family metallopeptidase [Intestinimonas sp.]|jgi:murein DD-endopeptidase MepM/ murein hydrolase activator NlpD|nr:M23 family metallopeptidase [Intestinimonas sp.]